jgi:SAM-dependent methyltransferase
VSVETWDVWNAIGGPKYPHNSVVSFVFNKFSKNPAANANFKALDLGCGSGVHTTFLAAEGFNTYALDSSETAVKNTRAALDERGLTASLVKCRSIENEYPKHFFDLVLCISVLECQPKRDLRENFYQICRILKPSGFALIIAAAEGDFRVNPAHVKSENTFHIESISREDLDSTFGVNCKENHEHKIDFIEQTRNGGAEIQSDFVLSIVPREAERT